jgi:hypothetical protein
MYMGERSERERDETARRWQPAAREGESAAAYATAVADSTAESS